MHIRSFRPGEELALHEVFHSAVHGLASRDYAPEQVAAWAPADFDRAAWRQRIQAIQPFVVEHGDRVVAYADVQPSGYIDQFFVSAGHAGRGIGRLLMAHLHEVARRQAIPVLSSDVSRTAQPFFAKAGFAVVEQRFPVVRGVVVPNAFMRKRLAPVPAGFRSGSVDPTPALG